MNRLLLPTLLLLLISGASCFAQSSVWKVSAGGKTVYVGGTCHMLRPTDFPLPPEFDVAYAAAQSLWFETDLARLTEPSTQQMIMSRGMYGAESSLQKEISPEAWAAVEAYCASAGLPIGMMNRFRPWLFSITVATVELQKLGVTDQGVDRHFHQQAANDGKSAHGLEAFEQHLEFIFNLGAGQENEMVIHSVKEAREIPQMFTDVVAAWRVGDLTKLDQLLSAEIRRDYPKVYEELITKRNAAWLPQIEAMLQSEPTELVLVGVGHLAGTEGIIAALQGRGLLVEQIKAAP